MSHPCSFLVGSHRSLLPFSGCAGKLCKETTAGKCGGGFFFFSSPLKLCVVLRVWHRLYSKSLHLEQPQCELGASHCLILMQPKESVGRGKRSSKEAKEAQGLGPNIPLHMLDAQGTQCGLEKAG